MFGSPMKLLKNASCTSLYKLSPVKSYLYVFQEAPMKNLKKVDCALLPPCSKTVHNKMLRAQYVSIVWGNAESAYPESGLNPCDYGWNIKNGSYIPVWFSGPAEPNNLFEDEEPESHEAENDTDGDVEEYEDAENSGSELEWSDDSESEDYL